MGFFNERYNDRDVTARKNMRNLINSDANEDKKNKELYQIADEVEEDVIKIQPIYKAIKEHTKADKEEICKMLKV